jgi:Trp operon repressor
MDKEHSMGTRPMMHAGAMSAIVELMTEMWGLLTEEQKKKVMVMRIDIITQLMETEISNEERMNEVKKKAIADIRKVQEMLK